MAKLAKYNLQGQQVGEVDVDDRLVEASANSQMVKDYLVALRNNARQWSACTKTRGLIARTTKKPYAQKGTGRARQGRTSSPQYRGGGIVFGPQPKFDQHVRINKKERRAAIRSLIAEKIREARLYVVDSFEMTAPKTKVVSSFLEGMDFDRRVLFLGEGAYCEVQHGDEKLKVSTRCSEHLNFTRSVSNLPKASFSLAMNISGYDVAVANDIVVTEKALHEIIQWLI